MTGMHPFLAMGLGDNGASLTQQAVTSSQPTTIVSPVNFIVLVLPEEALQATARPFFAVTTDV
jgi:hypothetical protein